MVSVNVFTDDESDAIDGTSAVLGTDSSVVTVAEITFKSLGSVAGVDISVVRLKIDDVVSSALYDGVIAIPVFDSVKPTAVAISAKQKIFQIDFIKAVRFYLCWLTSMLFSISFCIFMCTCMCIVSS